MKKVLCFIVVSFFVIKSASSQDLIIKNNGDTILVKILEITDEAVRYKKTNNLEGPTFVSNKAELNKIIYSNGTEEKIEAASSAPKPEPPLSKPAEPNIDTRSNALGNAKKNYDISADFEEVRIEPFGYYYKGMRMNEARLLYLYRSFNDQSVLTEFKSAKNLKTTATIVSLVGIPFAVSGVIMSIISFVPTNVYDDTTGDSSTEFKNRNLLGTGIGLFAGFIGMEVTSGILRGMHKSRLKKTVIHYNSLVAKHELK